MQNTLLYGTDYIQSLTSNDFTLSANVRIGLQSEQKICVVLFYSNNIMSERLLKMMSIISQEIVGVTFAACNILIQKQVFEAFQNLNSELSYCYTSKWPIMIVYRTGFPTGRYMGDFDYKDVYEWCSVLTKL